MTPPTEQNEFKDRMVTLFTKNIFSIGGSYEYS